MQRSVAIALFVALAGAAVPASAGVVFSNVTIGGSLAAGASFNTGPSDIDFIFPDARVGDTVDPIRTGTIVITYIASGTDGTTFDSMLAIVAGALAGSGKIFFSEVIEDLNGAGILASYNTTLDDFSDLPHSNTMSFSQPSDYIKVKKTFILDAIDTQEFDLADISLVEQRLIPGAGTGALLALAALPMARRRRA